MITSLDKFGRLLIPKKIREAIGLTQDVLLQLRWEGTQIIIEPVHKDPLYVEEEGFVFFDGSYDSLNEDALTDDRNLRDKGLLGL